MKKRAKYVFFHHFSGGGFLQTVHVKISRDFTVGLAEKNYEVKMSEINPSRPFEITESKKNICGVCPDDIRKPAVSKTIPLVSQNNGRRGVT